jgi:hypothetical protein
MQESTVQWDLRQVDYYPPVTTKLYILFLFVCCVWGATVLIKTLWRTRFWASTHRGTLIALSHALQSADALQVSMLAAEIPEASRKLVFAGLSPLNRLRFTNYPATLSIELTCALHTHSLPSAPPPRISKILPRCY